MAEDKKEKEAKEKNNFNFRDFYAIVKKKWYWVALSVICCMTLSVLYVMRATPKYKLEASVIVKDQSDGISLGGIPDMGLPDLGLFGGNSNYENELVTFRSPDYMEDVVRRLGLRTTYIRKEGLRKVPLYGEDLPITVDFLDLDEDESANIRFEVMKNGDIRLEKKMYVNGKKAEMDSDMLTRFDTTISTPAGAIVFHKTKYWGAKPRVKHNRGSKDVADEFPMNFRVSFNTINGAVEANLAKIDVSKENDKGATVINFTAKNACPQEGIDILNALLDVYNERWTNEKNQIAVNTSIFIDERLKLLAGELGDVEGEIKDYKKKKYIIDAEGNARIALERIAEVDRQYIENSNTLEVAKYLRDFLSKESNHYQTLPVNLGLANTSVERQISDYNEMLINRNTLVANSSIHNPMVQTLDGNLATLRRSIMAAINTQVATLSTAVEAIKREQANNNRNIAEGTDQEAFLREQGREQLVKEQLYVFLLQKKEENEISRSFAGQNIKVIRRPNGSDDPYSPRTKLIYAFGLLFGLAFPIGWMYIKEVTNTKVRSRKDVEGLGIPVLGEVPQLRKKMPKESKVAGDNIVVGEGQRDVVNESFRVVRTNLGLMTASDPKGTVVMLTSFIPNSGKTFITLNLGVACSMKKKVVIVDCDLRKRSATAAVGLKHKGLTDYLNGNVNDINSLLVCDTLHKNLCVLPAGTLPPNPTELLELPRFKHIIEELRKEFDYVLIDCPPTEMMADTQIINELTDRTIYVVRAGNLELAALPTLKQYYEEKKFKNISIVLNGLDEVQGGYGSYGYGYGEMEKELKGWRKLFKKS